MNSMKKIIIAEIGLIAAFGVGLFVGYLWFNSDGNYEQYYEQAEQAWQKAQKVDNPPVTLDDPDQKRVRKVRALYREIVDKYADSPWGDDALQRLGTIARYEEEQFALFRRLINNYPDSDWADDALYAIAVSQYRIAEKKKVVETPEAANAYYQRALVLFDRLIQDYPGSILVNESRLSRALCYYAQGNLGRALEAFNVLKTDFRDSVLIHSVMYYTGKTFFEKQEYETARVEFLNVVQSGHPELGPSAQIGIAQTYLAEKEYEKAIEAYQRAIDKYPETSIAEDAYFYIGKAYELLERYDDAIAQIEEAINNYPRNENVSNYRYLLAKIYFLNDDTQGSVETYRKVAENPTLGYDTRRSAQYAIGKIYETTEDIQMALDEYTKLLKEFPEPHNYPGHPSNNINENYLQKLQTRLQAGGL